MASADDQPTPHQEEQERQEEQEEQEELEELEEQKQQEEAPAVPLQGIVDYPLPEPAPGFLGNLNPDQQAVRQSNPVCCS